MVGIFTEGTGIQLGKSTGMEWILVAAGMGENRSEKHIVMDF